MGKWFIIFDDLGNERVQDPLIVAFASPWIETQVNDFDVFPVGYKHIDVTSMLNFEYEKELTKQVPV